MAALEWAGTVCASCNTTMVYCGFSAGNTPANQLFSAPRRPGTAQSGRCRSCPQPSFPATPPRALCRSPPPPPAASAGPTRSPPRPPVPPSCGPTASTVRRSFRPACSLEREVPDTSRSQGRSASRRSVPASPAAPPARSRSLRRPRWTSGQPAPAAFPPRCGSCRSAPQPAQSQAAPPACAPALPLVSAPSG